MTKKKSKILQRKKFCDFGSGFVFQTKEAKASVIQFLFLVATKGKRRCEEVLFFLPCPHRRFRVSRAGCTTLTDHVHHGDMIVWFWWPAWLSNLVRFLSFLSFLLLLSSALLIFGVCLCVMPCQACCVQCSWSWFCYDVWVESEGGEIYPFLLLLAYLSSTLFCFALLWFWF